MALDFSNPEIRFLADSVREAALLTQRIRRSLDVKEVTKNDLSPVTVADFAAQAVVARALERVFPDAVLVGEESAQLLQGDAGRPVREAVVRFVHEVTPDATEEDVLAWIDQGKAAPADRFWTLDPIDGTKGYLRGEQFAVALALIEDGRVVLGGLGCPNLAADCSLNGGGGALAVAARGQGAWAAPLNDGTDFQPLHVSDRSRMEDARLLQSVESGHTNVDQLDVFRTTMGLKAAPVRLDSQAKYALLAGGHGDLLLRLISPGKPDYKELIWDQAAGSIVVEEAGGRVTDLDGRPLDFTQGRTLRNNRGVCASNGRLHDAALEALRQLG